MATKNENKSKVLARVTFVADKMVRNLKKCLNGHDQRAIVKMPGIEVESGLLLATDGHILAVHKAKDYRCELGEGVFVLNGCYLLPVEVLKMKGQVTVEITSDGSDTVVSASDENVCGEVKQVVRYPNWRAVMPWSSGSSIDVNAKAWDAVLKEMLPKIDKSFMNYPMRVYAEKKSKTVALSHYNSDTNETWQKDVEVEGGMPYKVSVSFNCKMLRDVLAFDPTGMRFYDNSKAVMFHGDDTLVLLMPLWLSNNDAPACRISKSDVDVFSFEDWLGAPKEVAAQKEAGPKTQPAKAAMISQQTRQATAEPTMADKLRAVLLARLAA